MGLNNFLKNKANEVIEFQHANLSSLFKRLHRVKDEEDISEILSLITIQLSHHFSDEEKYMKEFSAPFEYQIAHKKAHCEIIERLAEYHFDLSHGAKLPLEQLLMLVDGWINAHVEKYDRLFLNWDLN